MKKMLAVLLTALLLMAGFASAEEVEPTVYFTENWAYILLEDGTAEIVGHNSGATTLIVPGEIDGHMVTRIGVDAFNHCNSLTSITLPDSLSSIGAPVFTRCTKLTDIIVSPDHPTLATINGVLFEKTEKRLVCYPCAFTADSYTVPQGIHIIGDRAFDCCDSLASITLPDSITTIGDLAFYYSSLASITLPNSITSIGSNAFSGCASTLTLTIPRDSWLVQWCKDNDLNYTYPDSLDWLLD